MNPKEIDANLFGLIQLEYANPRKLPMARECVRHSDLLQDGKLQFRSRSALIDASLELNRTDEALVAAAWCLGSLDGFDELEYWDQYLFLWHLKNLFRAVDDVPSISREKIESIGTQIQELYQEHGYNSRPIEHIRALHAFSRGDLDGVKQHTDTAMCEPRDKMADCEACETEARVKFALARGDYESADQFAESLFNGKETCSTVPHTTYGFFLRHLVDRGETDLAIRMDETGLSKLRSRPERIEAGARHIAFQNHQGDLDKSLARFQCFVRFICESQSPGDLYHLYVASEQLWEKLTELGEPRRLMLPTELPIYQQKGIYEPEVVYRWFADQSAELASAFDQRNGNDHYANHLRASLRYELV